MEKKYNIESTEIVFIRSILITGFNSVMSAFEFQSRTSWNTKERVIVRFTQDDEESQSKEIQGRSHPFQPLPQCFLVVQRALP